MSWFSYSAQNMLNWGFRCSFPLKLEYFSLDTSRDFLENCCVGLYCLDYLDDLGHCVHIVYISNTRFATLFRFAVFECCVSKHNISSSAWSCFRLNFMILIQFRVEANIGSIYHAYDITCVLRVRAVFHKTVRVCHVYCNLKIGFTCRITVIFGTLKDGSLLINTLASKICFNYRNMFQNGVDALSKIVDAFLSKSSKFYLVRIIR